MATNRYICEVCHKGFQRDQNLQLHRRGHNLPWKLKQRPNTQVKRRVYVCPEPICVHHDPSRALGDLTGIKKHFCRKHGEKKWKCDRCSKRYAVRSDWNSGRLTPRSVGLENIVVIVVQFSQGETFLFKFSVFIFLYFLL